MWVQQVGCGVQALTFARDGRTLYTVDTARRLIAWDTSTRARREVAVGIESHWLTAEHFIELPDGRLVVDCLQGFHLVDPVTAAHSRVSPANRVFGNVCGSVLADGRAFFLRHGRLPVGCVNLLTGAELPVVELPTASGLYLLCVAPDGASAFLGWGGQPRSLFDLTRGVVARGGEDVVSGIAIPRFAPDRRTVVLLQLVGQPQLTMWDIEQRAARAKPVWWAGGNTVRIAFNPVLPLFAVPHTQNTVAVRSLETGELVRELDFALGKQITALAFAPDGLTCAVGGTNKRFAVFDVDV